jgi:hypothetical protein
MKRRRMLGKVQKVIKPAHPDDSEKAEIHIDEADDLYREVRVENVLENHKGQKVALKPGAEVDVIVEADSSATIEKPSKI